MQKPSYSKTEKYNTKNNCYIIKVLLFFLINFNMQLYKIKLGYKKAMGKLLYQKAMGKYL